MCLLFIHFQYMGGSALQILVLFEENYKTIFCAIYIPYGNKSVFADTISMMRTTDIFVHENNESNQIYRSKIYYLHILLRFDDMLSLMYRAQTNRTNVCPFARFVCVCAQTFVLITV